MQVHRSFIVNLSHIQAIEGNQLVIGEHKIPVFRPMREEVYKAIINNQLITK
ncbi:LytTR family transcriptional regulator DNA-binding domain-containing protein [uncultured Parabacteroides sp.]|uniref:LytTR family transcriptional regulator DNA-binding domain-containing protein n=1 Tax=uncultured Parabacteroides sp. TaxID=512312 RepID=UPI0025EC9016|nr:LytTR family transcriptional regulator DNA-binding domain-containing protein [uncultured Parabacteroides sp.]